MFVEFTKRRSEKSALQQVVRIALCCALLAAYPQPAHATGIPVVDAVGNLLKDWGNAVQELGRIVETQITNMREDQKAANDRYNVNVATTAQMASNSYSSNKDSKFYIDGCGTQQDSYQKSQEKQRIASAARAMGATTVVGAKTAANAAKSYCTKGKNGFLETTGAAGAINKALGCTSAGSNAVYARADRVLNSLLGPLEYHAPDDMVKPVIGDTYKPFPTDTPTASTIDAYAALGYCINLANPEPVVPRATTVTTGGYAAVSTAPIREARLNRSMGNCWRYFQERLAYGQNSASFQDEYKKQVMRCDAHYREHVIDSAALADCRKNGRSALKADHDAAYYLQNPDVQTQLFVGLSDYEKLNLKEMGRQKEEAFEQRLEQEWTVMSAVPVSTGQDENDMLGATPTTP